MIALESGISDIIKNIYRGRQRQYKRSTSRLPVKKKFTDLGFLEDQRRLPKTQINPV